MSGTTDRWYLTGPLGVGTAFDEPTDAQSVPWSGVGTAVRHNGADALNLLDGRPGAVGQGPSLNWWGLNAAGKATRLGAVAARFAATGDGSAAGYLSFQTKPAGGDVAEALRIDSAGNVGIGTAQPDDRLDVEGNIRINDRSLFLRPGADPNHGLGWYGGSKTFAGAGPDGPVVYGFGGGALGTTAGGQRVALAWNSAGNVGVGTAASQARLQVAGGMWNPGDTEGDFKVGDANYRLKVGVATGGGGAGDIRIRAHGGTNRLMLGSGTTDTLFVVGGNVGIGTPDPQYALHVKTGWGLMGLDTLGVNQHSGLRLQENGAVKWHLWNDGSASGNNLNINPNGGPGLVVNQNGNLQIHGRHVGIYDRSWGAIPTWSGSGLHCWDFFYGGGTYKLSTIREKDNVRPLTDVLARIDRLNPVSYDRPRRGNPVPHDIGFIAEEVREVFPECAAELAAGEPGFFAWGVNESALHGVAIAGIQELSRKLKALKRGLAVSRSGDVAIGADRPLPGHQLYVAGAVRLDCPTATTASPGEGALPDRPAGFLTLNINGRDCKLPFYHA